MNSQCVVNLQLSGAKHYPTPVRRTARSDYGVRDAEAFRTLPQRIDILVENVDLQMIVRIDPLDLTHESVPKAA